MNEKEWYDDENLITSLLIGLLILIIIVSQSFAIRQQLGLGFMVRSLLNYNSVYLIFLTYLIMIKTKFGKKNFNLCNVVLTLIQLLVLLAALFNIFQGFYLSTIVNFILNVLLFGYMIYSLLKGTSIWGNLHLDKVPFNKITNDQYFCGITILAFLSLITNLIGNFTFNGIVMLLLEALFTIGLSRYLYLWKDYQDKKEEKKKDVTKNKKILEEK